MSADELQTLIATAAAHRVVVSIDPSGAVTLTPMDGKPAGKSSERMRRYRERRQNVTDVTAKASHVTAKASQSVTCDATPPPLPEGLEGFALEAPEGKQPKRFVAPTETQWLAFAATLSPPFPATAASRAWNHYVANGWKVGKSPMKDWKAACRTCHSYEQERNAPPPSPPQTPTKKLPWE